MATIGPLTPMGGYVLAAVLLVVALVQRRQLRTWRMDELTNLPVRREFHRRARRALRRGGQVLVFIDLDRFKAINDRWGYDIGDATLAVTARRIRAVLRGRGFAGRYGGDEFAAVITPQPHETIHQVLYRLVQAIAAPLELPSDRTQHGGPIDAMEVRTFFLGASLGAVDLTDVPRPDLAGTMIVANQLMVQAKGRGGGINLVTGQPHDERLSRPRGSRSQR
ncbi:GGDEF domain-containing protein [Kibdelosporangium phytohabitans]|uniref:GGDEF domain-containing protein n=1 Tax=Kibdelosporangium phytohabitans TaxID=860235 RepID=A0A0N9HW58_9PSEU|nr:GGDEF domain-containing protein [Kibdelosporangium phytohabitans]ALG06329.1 hypothetical protein AOZ06_04780 [Kibdelosporangium phytohabitans]MBE1467460.1 diguanylate cyclase (GGDEF)-like protein [Kibdelosporangium phytohabitans]